MKSSEAFERSRVVRVDFRTGGILGSVRSPKELRRYKEVLAALWHTFGTIERSFYPKDLSYCVLEFRLPIEASTAVTFLNDPDYFAAILEGFVRR